MRQLIIVRGPSGSGKSTIASYLRDHYTGFPAASKHEADSFFVTYDGRYKFDASKLAFAHNWCQSNVAHMMFQNIERVIVSNTTTTMRELQMYLDLAARFDYKVRVIRTPGPWDPSVLFKRNKHNVPLDVIEKQIARYIEYDGEEEWSDMSIYQ